MVLYKRKPVKYDPLPAFLDDNLEIWAIEATGEVFTDYERYLARRDFYLQKCFTCESTGHQGLTFFEAQDSENEASMEVNSILPEQLRSRVLDFVQFKNTGRMDDLVNLVFDHFREHYMVGDRVTIEHEHSRRHGVISQIEDTSRLHTVSSNASDDQFRSFTYHIRLDNSQVHVTKYKASEIQRDRSYFSKLILKQFLRSTVTRESWNGAPWRVKEHLARKYDIPLTVPEAKTRDAIMAAKKAENAARIQNAQNAQAAANAAAANSGSQTHRGANGRAHGNGHAFVNYSANAHQQPPFRQDGHPPLPPFYDPQRPPQPYPHQMNGSHGPSPSPGPGQQLPPIYQAVPMQALPPHLQYLFHQPQPSLSTQGAPGGPALPINPPFHNNFMQYQTLAPTNTSSPSQTPSVPPQRLYEPVKYPTEDLRIREPKTSVQRPPLKFISDDVPEGGEPPAEKTGIQMKSVGKLLCTWDTLNVHDTIYHLDSFTLDDFVDAMGYSSEEVECELLTEVHCAVLKQIVNTQGRIQVNLPHATDEEDEDDEDEKDSGKESSPEPEPAPVRTTRSSLRRSGANALAKQRTPTPEPPKQMHKAAEFLADYHWHEQLRVRNFREGGWQAILVGILYRLSFGPVHKEACDEILAALVPPEDEPTVETIAYNYVYMDINLRIAALEMILLLTISTEAFRDQLLSASADMTKLRKEKIEHQRKRKELADELFKLDMERKILLPQNMPASPTEAKAVLAVTEPANGVDKETNDEDEEPSEIAEGSGEEENTAATGSRRLRHTKQNKRKRESESAKKEKAKKAKIEAAKTKQQKEWEALLESIEKKKSEIEECEANIQELDDDLREALVHRSKIIGKDRFMNKYYWFEHNGMPFGGVPTSSTAEYGYANGRLWVQGPDEHELQPNLEEPALTQDQQEFGWTVPGRKEREEGDTHLNSSTQWGYYDDPEDLDKILAWLDDRGVREKALRKELLLFKDRIAEYMVKMREHLTVAEKKKEEGDDEEDAVRVTTRNMKYIDKDSTKDLCLLWTNSIYRSETGHNHSEEYKAPKSKKGTAKAVKARAKKN